MGKHAILPSAVTTFTSCSYDDGMGLDPHRLNLMLGFGHSNKLEQFKGRCVWATMPSLHVTLAMYTSFQFAVPTQSERFCMGCTGDG